MLKKVALMGCVSFRSNTISAIASIVEKEQVKLSGVPLQDPMYHASQFIIQKLDFEGSFFALTKTLDRLQKTNGIGRVRAVTYRLTGSNSNSDEVKAWYWKFIWKRSSRLLLTQCLNRLKLTGNFTTEMLHEFKICFIVIWKIFFIFITAR